jgi:hypothetical protein
MSSKGNGGRPVAIRIRQYKDGIEVSVEVEEGSPIDAGEVTERIAHLAEQILRRWGLDGKISDIEPPGA